MPSAKDTYSIKELIALAESCVGDDGELEYSLPERFIYGLGIQECWSWIRPMVVWLRFKEWCVENKLKRCTRTQFFKEFNEFFPRHRWGVARFYKLDPRPFTLSRASQLALERFSKAASQNARKKTDKKKPD